MVVDIKMVVVVVMIAEGTKVMSVVVSLEVY